MFTYSHIKKALSFAAEKHDGQYRKGSGRVPYIVHPVQVAFNVSLYTKDKGIVAAAFLHDVLEDCSGVSVFVLQKEFGKRVARLVQELSFLEKKKYKIWKEKKLTYLNKIKKASKDALMIVAVDKMSNLEAYFNALKKKGAKKLSNFGGTPDEYRWYYEEIEKILISRLGRRPVVKDYIKIRKSFK